MSNPKDYLEKIKEGVIKEPSDLNLMENISVTKDIIDLLNKLDCHNIYANLDEEDRHAVTVEISRIKDRVYELKEFFLEIEHNNTQTELMVQKQINRLKRVKRANKDPFNLLGASSTEEKSL